MKKRKPIGKGQQQNWIQNSLEKISVHGLAWYQRSNSKFVRCFIVIFALVVLFGLPMWTIYEFIQFFTTIQIKTVTETAKGTNLHYPNLTVCHPKYFDNELLKGTDFLKKVYLFHIL